MGSRIRLRIDAVAAGGDGVGRHDARVIFVPLSAPGDLVWIEIVQCRKRFARGRLLEVIEAGERRTAPCDHFAQCGGCSWLHLPESVQSAARVRILMDALRRIGAWQSLPEVEELSSPRSLGYRSRARVAHARGRVGFRERGSHRVVPVRHCAVLDEPTQRELEALWRRPPRGSGEIEIRGFARRVDGLRVSPGVFFQANRSLWKDWIERVLDCCDRGELLLELYAGVGFFTAQLQSRFVRAIAVEQSEAARDLAANSRAEVVHASVEAFLDAYAFDPVPDVVLLNPPRTGCTPDVLPRIAAAGPKRIVYVSCEPATLARDSLALSQGYSIRRLVCLDALPQTHHVEAIAVFERDVPQTKRSPNAATSDARAESA